jgi:hypothetical protein
MDAPAPQVSRLSPGVARLVRSHAAVPGVAGALRQLVHNARDAGAAAVHCTFARAEWTLAAVDDGVGVGVRGLAVLASGWGVTSKLDGREFRGSGGGANGGLGHDAGRRRQQQQQRLPPFGSVAEGPEEGPSPGSGGGSRSRSWSRSAHGRQRPVGSATPPTGVIGRGSGSGPRRVTLPPPVWRDGISVGFKGEALFALSCLGDLTVSSRAEGDPDEAWTTAKISAGQLLDIDAGREERHCGRRGGTGTIVTVANIFARHPVRRRAADAAALAAELRKMLAEEAIAHPTLAISLTDGDAGVVVADWAPGGVPARMADAMGMQEADLLVAAEATVGVGRR